MGQSLVKNYMHLVFSTKYRQNLIHAPHESDLHAYLGGICANLECQPLKVGGYTDHVHVLFMLSKRMPLADLVEKVKSNSSRWMKTRDPDLKNFYWQNGYAAFSVDCYRVETVIRYIENQKEHHKKITFQDEVRQFLTEYGIEYDERYLWD